MASPRMMPSDSDLVGLHSSSTHSVTLANLQSVPSISGDPAKPLIGSVSMDDLLRSVYGDSITTTPQVADGFPGVEASEPPRGDSAPQPLAKEESFSLLRSQVWKEISAGGAELDGSWCKEGSDQQDMMTLEDFLARAGAVCEEDVRVSAVVGFATDPAMGSEYGQQDNLPTIDFVDAMDGGGVGGGKAAGRRRKRALMDPTDRAAIQKQERMIKNRESAARSRERKQAYTVELETLVMKLEEENAALLQEQEDEYKMRQQVLLNVIPVTEKKPPTACFQKNKVNAVVDNSWQPCEGTNRPTCFLLL